MKSFCVRDIPRMLLITKDKDVQALVIGYDNQNDQLIAQVKNKRALIAREDITIYQRNNNDEEIAKLLGSTVNATVIGKANDDIKLSRKRLMQKQIHKYEKGSVVNATIVSASNNALYLEFDEGLVGKMYLNELTSSKVEKPLDIYDIGDTIECMITKKQDDGRFLLSRLVLCKQKSLNVEIGNILKCKITKKVQPEDGAGFFVEVVDFPDYSGIFDINKYNYKNNYKVGDDVNLRVVEVKKDKKLRLRTNF